MKNKLFYLILTAFLVASCGGTDYTTDKEKALELAKDIRIDETKAYDEILDKKKAFIKERKELLKDYDNNENKLLKKAKKGDEDALKTLKELRNKELELDYEAADLFLEIHKKEVTLEHSVRDIRYINDKEDLKDWNYDIYQYYAKKQKAYEQFEKKLQKLEEEEYSSESDEDE